MPLATPGIHWLTGICWGWLAAKVSSSVLPVLPETNSALATTMSVFLTTWPVPSVTTLVVVSLVVKGALSTLSDGLAGVPPTVMPARSPLAAGVIGGGVADAGVAGAEGLGAGVVVVEVVVEAPPLPHALSAMAGTAVR